MAKAKDAVPRPAHRPKKDNTDLVIDFWVEWLRDRRPRDEAIRAVATADRAKQERITVKTLRERVRAALDDELISWPQLFEVAQQRGVAVLPKALLPVDLTPPSPPLPPLTDAHVDHIRRLVLYARSIDDILSSDTPISEVNKLFLAHRATLRRRRRK
jgi:hypothetical protein